MPTTTALTPRQIGMAVASIPPGCAGMDYRGGEPSVGRSRLAQQLAGFARTGDSADAWGH